jgi:hypothetical protein
VNGTEFGRRLMSAFVNKAMSFLWIPYELISDKYVLARNS